MTYTFAGPCRSDTYLKLILYFVGALLEMPVNLVTFGMLMIFFCNPSVSYIIAWPCYRTKVVILDLSQINQNSI